MSHCTRMSAMGAHGRTRGLSRSSCHQLCLDNVGKSMDNKLKWESWSPQDMNEHAEKGGRSSNIGYHLVRRRWQRDMSAATVVETSSGKNRQEMLTLVKCGKNRCSGVLKKH